MGGGITTDSLLTWPCDKTTPDLNKILKANFGEDSLLKINVFVCPVGFLTSWVRSLTWNNNNMCFEAPLNILIFKGKRKEKIKFFSTKYEEKILAVENVWPNIISWKTQLHPTQKLLLAASILSIAADA